MNFWTKLATTGDVLLAGCAQQPEKQPPAMSVPVPLSCPSAFFTACGPEFSTGSLDTLRIQIGGDLPKRRLTGGLRLLNARLDLLRAFEPAAVP